MIFKCDIYSAWLGYVRTEVNIVSKCNVNASRHEQNQTDGCLTYLVVITKDKFSRDVAHGPILKYTPVFINNLEQHRL